MLEVGVGRDIWYDWIKCLMVMELGGGAGRRAGCVMELGLSALPLLLAGC